MHKIHTTLETWGITPCCVLVTFCIVAVWGIDVAK